jgi:crotonobetainyl-CoA:carnitine CoA-transferase CaiB-like acyl-CoA transferase
MSYDLLEGVRVVELSLYAFAPSAAAVLSDWGADVVKVVPPKVADPMMGTPIAGLPRKDVGVAFMWELLNGANAAWSLTSRHRRVATYCWTSWLAPTCS